MKNFKEFITEQQIDIISNRDLKKELTGFKVKSYHDRQGTFTVTVKNKNEKKKLLAWMLKNGWDKTDIKDGYDTEFQGLI